MFHHSVPVPRLYKFAAKVAKQVKEDGASLKDKIYQLNHRNIKGVYALVTSVLKQAAILDYIIRSTQILFKENRLDPWLARVLITELLWGKKRLPNVSKPCQTILNYTQELNDCLATFGDDVRKIKASANKVKKPRYVRVNTIKLSMIDAINIFRDEGWILLRCGDNTDYGSFLATVASLSQDQFICDMHIKDLLIFPPNTQFYKHDLYLNGDIILQDKASCLAPFILAPEPGTKVLDMCSAPGMKASQMAAMVKNEGVVYAIERDQRRYQTLCKLMEGVSAINVKCVNKDVLTITDKDFPDIEYILVDPSCSGSGMVDRPDYEDPNIKCDKSRLQSLAGFQITILRHALYNFSKAKRVVYSTCSLYADENESVVEQVITTVKDFKLADLGSAMKANWFHFGDEQFGPIGKRCLYAKPEDYTNGFFVALFERLGPEEKNEFFVKRVKRASESETLVENKDKPNFELSVEEDKKVEEDKQVEEEKPDFESTIKEPKKLEFKFKPNAEPKVERRKKLKKKVKKDKSKIESTSDGTKKVKFQKNLEIIDDKPKKIKKDEANFEVIIREPKKILKDTPYSSNYEVFVANEAEKPQQNPETFEKPPKKKKKCREYELILEIDPPEPKPRKYFKTGAAITPETEKKKKSTNIEIEEEIIIELKPRKKKSKTEQI